MHINFIPRVADYSNTQPASLLTEPAPIPVPSPPVSSGVETENSPLSGAKTPETTVPWTKRDEKPKPTWPTTAPTHGDKLVGAGRSGEKILEKISSVPAVGIVPTLITHPGTYAHPIEALKNGNVNPLLAYVGITTAAAIVAPELLVAVGVGAALKMSLFS